MNLAQAIEHANALSLPGFFSDDATLVAEREKNEEAIGLLTAAWMDAPLGSEPFSFDIVRELADRNRETCDEYGAQRLRDAQGSSLARKLSDSDLVRGVAAMQHRKPSDVERDAGPGLKDLNIAYLNAPVSGTVVGIDIETTDRFPNRGYIVNVGLQIAELTPSGTCDEGYVAYCGIPEEYAEKGVPLADIHHISWDDLAGKKPFRRNAQLQKAILAALTSYPYMAHNAAFEDSWFMLHLNGYAEARKAGRIIPIAQLQKAILAALTSYPYMAHNAAFEDSWFMLHLNGYAEARKAGRIIPIDTRDICRRLDPEVKVLPHEARPATLENWARRRGTLKPNEKERHLGLDDVDLMLRTVQAEFSERNMF